MAESCDECSPCWPHRGGYGRCPCDCHPADPAADLEYAMAVIEYLVAENERLRAELRRFQRIIIDASEATADCEDLCGVLCAGPCQGLDEIAAISQAAGLDELTGEPPIRRPYPLVGPHQGDPMTEHSEEIASVPDAPHDPDYRRPSVADGTVAAGLVALLRSAGDEWGPRGVAFAAAELAGLVLTQHDEWCDVECPHEPARSDSSATASDE